MESTSLASSSCWCCAECIQSRLDRQSSAAADADDDGGGGDAMCNGLVQADQLCEAHDNGDADDDSDEDLLPHHLVSVATFVFPIELILYMLECQVSK